jgi:hypothetical protein
MSNSSEKTRSSFFSEGLSAGSVQKEFIEAPLAAARQPAIATGLDLLAFMSAMPDIFLASEQRELRRLARTSENKNDPRIERLKVSIERATELSNTANLGKARIDRTIVAASTEENVFHGFVSDANLKPREKLTVRISAARNGDTGNDKETKSLSTTTDTDGYFSISLGKERNDHRKTGAYESTVKLSEQMAERLASVNAKAKTDTSAASNPRGAAAAAIENSNEVLARVEILDANRNIVHQDDSPLVINAGTAYREYVLVDDASQKPKSYDTKLTAAAAAEKTASKKATDISASKPMDNSLKAETARKPKDTGKTKK